MNPFRPSWLLQFPVYAALISAPAFGFHARAEDPPKPAQTDAAKAKERELLDSAFKSLEEELKYAVQEFSAAQSAASAKGLPRDQWPKNPAPDFYQRFEALAMQDQPDAQRWCIGVMPSSGFAMDEMISRKDALYKRYVAANVNAGPTADIVMFLQAEAAPGGIGLDRTLPLLEEIVKNCRNPEARSQAMWVRAQLLVKSPRAEHKAIATQSLHAFVDAYPQSRDAAQAKAILFHIERLGIGMVAPDVVTADVDGQPFKLSDSRGQVTIVVFFGFWRQQSTQPFAQLKALCEKLKDKPFKVIAVNTDDDKATFKQRFAEFAVPCKVSWQGGKTGPWVTEWAIGRLPTTFVLDGKGVIRFKDISGQPLTKAVDDLMTEIEAEKAKNPPK